MKTFLDLVFIKMKSEEIDTIKKHFALQLQFSSLSTNIDGLFLYVCFVVSWKNLL